MSDTVQIVNIVMGTGSAMFLAYLAYLGKRAESQVREVKKTLEVSTAAQDRKLDTILRVTDGALGKQMRIAADALRVIADKTGDAGHIATADNAERDYQDHEKIQADAEKPKEGEPGNPTSI